jgi:tetratricopeptide (TPR) repeat protein
LFVNGDIVIFFDAWRQYCLISEKSKKMSTETAAATEADIMLCCASCGTAAIDDIKLKKCACKLVQYCSLDCQKNHRPQHKKLCRKRLAELRDEGLFALPESSYLGECPICCLPLSIDPDESMLMSCCCKVVCQGCDYANRKREFEGRLEHRCAFCRHPLVQSMEDVLKRVMKRVKKNDSAAMSWMGKTRRDEGDYETALEYLTKAAELGDAGAHYQLFIMYYKGQGVEKDEKKEIYHLEEAAIGGHPVARHNLGIVEVDNDRFDRAKKHFIIAANLGDHDSLKELKNFYANGYASNEDYAGALRAYQAAVDATKSLEREEAANARV